MAKYRSIQTSFWSDSKIVDDFTPEDRYFYLYILTNEKSNQLGCYELSINQMCRDTGYNEETIKKLIERFSKIHKIIDYDFSTKEIYIKNWYKYNWLDSVNTKICIDKEFCLLKSIKLKDMVSPFIAHYMPLPSNKKKKNNKKNNNNNTKSINNTNINSSITAIKEKNINKSVCVNKKDCVGTPPTLDLIISFCKEKEYKDFDCEKFFNYYESNGWTDTNGNKVVNWKAKLSYWHNQDMKKGNKKEGVEQYETV